jgi:hypothetical protein
MTRMCELAGCRSNREELHRTINKRYIEGTDL